MVFRLLNIEVGNMCELCLIKACAYISLYKTKHSLTEYFTLLLEHKCVNMLFVYS